MVAANIVFNSAAWRATLGATPTGTVAASVPPTQSWGRAVSRHLRLVALLGQIPDSKSRSSANGNHHDSAGYSEAVLPQEMTTSLQQEHRQNPDASPHPLHCAASQGMLEAGAALLAANSNTVSVRDSSGRTALHWAAMVGATAFSAMLIDHAKKASPPSEGVASLVEARDNAGRTPLMYSAAFGALPMIKLLLEIGVINDAADDRGLTPLHAAAAGGHLEVARALLLAGANHTLAARAGATPRHVAERQGHVAMVRLLIKHAETQKRISGGVIAWLRGSDAFGVDLVANDNIRGGNYIRSGSDSSSRYS